MEEKDKEIIIKQINEQGVCLSLALVLANYI